MAKTLPVSSCPCVPALADWSMSAGGTSVPDDKHGYSARCSPGRAGDWRSGDRWAQLMITPTSTLRGRFLGYALDVAGSWPGRKGLWSRVSPAGGEVSSVERAFFRNPASAAVVARRYAKKHGLC